MAMLDASRATGDTRSAEKRPVPKACGRNGRRASSDVRARSAAALALTPPRLRQFLPHRGHRDCFSSLLVLAPGYFNCARFAPGDLVYVGTKPRLEHSPWSTQHRNRDIHRALLMIRGRDDQGRMRVRLVQDYGRPDDPDAPRVAAKRSRGRPRAA